MNFGFAGGVDFRLLHPLLANESEIIYLAIFASLVISPFALRSK